jgi:hypothetical protein
VLSGAVAELTSQLRMHESLQNSHGHQVLRQFERQAHHTRLPLPAAEAVDGPHANQRPQRVNCGNGTLVSGTVADCQDDRCTDPSSVADDTPFKWPPLTLDRPITEAGSLAVSTANLWKSVILASTERRAHRTLSF